MKTGMLFPLLLLIALPGVLLGEDTEKDQEVTVIKVGPEGVLQVITPAKNTKPSPDTAKESPEKKTQAEVEKQLSDLPKEIRELLEKRVGKGKLNNMRGRIIVIGPDGNEKLEIVGADDAKKEEPSKEPSAQLKILGTGGAFRLGPDGKVADLDLEKLPDDVKKLMQLKGLVDGKAYVAGQVTIIGPDGKRYTQQLDDKGIDGKSLTKILEKIMQQGGEELPKEVQEKLKKSFESIDLKVVEMKPNATNVKKPQAKVDPIISKLDEILRRLDSLDRRVKELEARE